MIIDKKAFTEVIEGFRDQYDYDIRQASKLSKVVGIDVPTYDNWKLTSTLFKALELLFPDDIEMIQDFCYELDFGRVDGVSIGDFWDRLHQLDEERFEATAKIVRDIVESGKVVREFPPEDESEIENRLSERTAIVKVSHENDRVPSLLEIPKKNRVPEHISDMEVNYEIVSPIKGRIFTLEDY